MTHVIHNLELFITSRVLSSRLRVVHVNHNLELFIVSRVLSSGTKVVHVIHNPELFIASRALKSMTRCNKIRIHYLFNDVLVHFYLSSFHVLYFMSIVVLLHCTWFRCIRSCIENLSHGFLANRWLVHNQFMGLGNPLEVVMHHLLIRGMVGLGYQDKFPMVSALVCMVTHWTRPIMSHDLRLSSSHDLTKLLRCVISQPWENIELVLKLAMTLTYRRDRKLIRYSLWIRSLSMEAGSNMYSQ